MQDETTKFYRDLMARAEARHAAVPAAVARIAKGLHLLEIEEQHLLALERRARRIMFAIIAGGFLLAFCIALVRGE